MLTFAQQLRYTHRFFSQQGLYPVFLATVLALGLFFGRVIYSKELTFLFLVWNLFLAWIPYLVSLSIARLHQRNAKRWWHLLLPSVLWLAFLPNAPYIITDFLHLDVRPPVPIWYDIGLLTVFAWTGLFLALYSLRSMQLVFKSYFGSILSWLFVMGVLGLSGLGIYIGRYLRWNSWDLLTQPDAIFFDLAIRLTNPLNHPGTYGVTLMFAAFLFVCYLTLTTVPSTISDA